MICKQNQQILASKSNHPISCILTEECCQGVPDRTGKLWMTTIRVEAGATLTPVVSRSSSIVSNSPVLQSARPRAVDSGEAKMRTASWGNVDKQCRARYEITHEHVSNDLKMWIKRIHTEIHIIITIYIHYKSIYFKIITCIILGLVNSNVFACKINSAFNDFVDSCLTGKHNRTGARAL